MFRKLASIPKDFQSIGGGFYKKAHEVWELIASEDENKPFKLIRVKSEKDFQVEAGLQKQAGMKKTASLERKGRVFRAGSLVEVTVRTDDGESSEVEHEDGVIEVLPSTMVHDAEPDISNMQMIPNDPAANVNAADVVPGAGDVDFTAEQAPEFQRPLEKVLEEVQFLMETRGYTSELVKIENALKKMIQEKNQTPEQKIAASSQKRVGNVKKKQKE